MIDVIVPAYNAHNTLDDLINSVIMQTINEDVTIYIINDCSDYDYSEFIKRYKRIITIKEYKTSVNGGPGVARQLGLKKSKSKYITFIDSDDIFDNCFALEVLYRTLEDNNANAVSSAFIEECNNSFITHDQQDIWMHGKMYRRSWS